jgi:hypothetical protein
MGSTLFLLGETLDDHFAHLTSVQLSFSHHRVHSPHLVGRAEGIQISRALSDLCSAPLLQKFRVDAYDGSACWDR